MTGPVMASMLAAAALLVPAAALAQAPDRIDLPDGWQPEGVASLGTTLFAGSLGDGAIWQGDATTGSGDVLVGGVAGRVAVGLEVELDAGRLWVAGGDTGEVRAYDVESGTLLQTYAFDAGFLNDLAVTPAAVYVTDSRVPQLLVIPIAEDGGLSAPDAAMALPLSGDVAYTAGFNLNGIVAAPAGLVVVQTSTGALFRVDPETAETSTIDTAGAELTAGDGLELDGSTLYVVRNQLNEVVALELDAGLTTATQSDRLTSDDLDTPATVTLVEDALWAANARFTTAATPDTPYWLTRLPVDGGDQG